MKKRSKNSRPCIAIQWDQDQLRYLAGSVNRGKVQVQSIGYLEKSEDETCAEVLERLKKETPSSARNSICVGLSRNQTEVFELKLPSVNQSALVEMVRNEVVRQSSDVRDDWPIDFELGQNEDGSIMTGLAFAVDPQVIEEKQADLKKAGMKSSSMTIRHLSALSLLKELSPQASVSRCLFINQSKYEIDLLVLRNGGLDYARTIQHNTSSEEEEDILSLISEVQRTMIVAPDEDESNPIQHIYMFGSVKRQNSIGGRLAEAVQIPVTTIDP